MAVIDIKGVRIGEGRPKAIVSLMDETLDALLDKAERAVAAGAEILEWRADFYPDITCTALAIDVCSALVEALPQTPLIFTLRSKGQGGQLELDDEAYAALVRAVAACGAPDLIDIELRLGDEMVRELVQLAQAAGVRAIVSHHDFEATPETEAMTELLVHMASLGADIPKLAVTPLNAQDPLRLMRATAQAREQVDVPLMTMSMGTAGQRTRLSGEVFGSTMTFCALGKPSAPGQVELQTALSTMDAIHRQYEAGL